MNMNVRVGKSLKKHAVCVNVILIFAAKLTYADYVTVYGMDAAEKYKHKHPNSTYFIQVASFATEGNARNYQQKIQKTTKYKVTINSKIVNNKNVYAVVIGPVGPNLKPISMQVSPTSNKLPLHKEVTNQAAVYVDKPWHDVNHLTAKNWWANSDWYLSIGGGEQFPNSTNNLRVNNGSDFPSPYNIDVYSGSSRTNGGIFALAGGRSWKNESYNIQSYSLGFMWQYLFRNNLNGQITQYSDPTFLNYNYELSTISNVILGYGKINFLSYKNLLPYFNVGLGGAINNTKKYHEEALDFVTARVSPQFQAQNNTQFAYLLGAGVDILANDKLSISAGYNYLNIGQLSTGYGVSTWSAARLNYGSSSTNEVLITLNYKFNKNRILS